MVVLAAVATAMKGWKAVTSATLEASQQEMERIMQEVDLLRNDSDSESEPSPVPCSSQTSDEAWSCAIFSQFRSKTAKTFLGPRLSTYL